MSTLEGGAELLRRINELDSKLGISTLRKGVKGATGKVAKQMKQKAPVGDRYHRVNSGRIVAPGFLRKSILIRTNINRAGGSIDATIGLARDAFYGHIIDNGSHNVTQRRVPVKKGSPDKYKRGKKLKRESTLIKPYTLRGKKFFKDVFISNQTVMEKTLISTLRSELDKL